MTTVYNVKYLVEGKKYDFTDSMGEAVRATFICKEDESDEESYQSDWWITLETENGGRIEWPAEEMKKAEEVA